MPALVIITIPVYVVVPVSIRSSLSLVAAIFIISVLLIVFIVGVVLLLIQLSVLFVLKVAGASMPLVSCFVIIKLIWGSIAAIIVLVPTPVSIVIPPLFQDSKGLITS